MAQGRTHSTKSCHGAHAAVGPKNDFALVAISHQGNACLTMAIHGPREGVRATRRLISRVRKLGCSLERGPIWKQSSDV